MDELGTLKVWVAFRFVDKRMGEAEKLVLVYSAWCTKQEAREEVRKLKRMNKSLPIMRANWTLVDEIELNEPLGVAVK